MAIFDRHQEIFLQGRPAAGPFRYRCDLPTVCLTSNITPDPQNGIGTTARRTRQPDSAGRAHLARPPPNQTIRLGSVDGSGLSAHLVRCRSHVSRLETRLRRQSNRSLSPRRIPAGKRFGQARDRAGIFGGYSVFRATETRLSRVSCAKAPEIKDNSGGVAKPHLRGTRYMPAGYGHRTGL
jgi:hypothetical protein